MTKKYVGCNRLFKRPVPCPECNRAGYIGPVHKIDYVTDYVTHRVGYHGISDYTVWCDLERILAKEDCYGCCCDCNCCCKKDCSNEITIRKSKLRELEDKLQEIQDEIEDIRGGCC